MLIWHAARKKALSLSQKWSFCLRRMRFCAFLHFGEAACHCKKKSPWTQKNNKILRLVSPGAPKRGLSVFPWLFCSDLGIRHLSAASSISPKCIVRNVGLKKSTWYFRHPTGGGGQVPWPLLPSPAASPLPDSFSPPRLLLPSQTPSPLPDPFSPPRPLLPSPIPSPRQGARARVWEGSGARA